MPNPPGPGFTGQLSEGFGSWRFYRDQKKMARLAVRSVASHAAHHQRLNRRKVFLANPCRGLSPLCTDRPYALADRAALPDRVVRVSLGSRHKIMESKDAVEEQIELGF